jgi:hypothetical protein
MSGLPTIFFSHSYRDKRFVDEMLVHLAQLKVRYEFDIWNEHGIETGKSWHSQVEAAVKQAQVAVVCVSADYLASSRITELELPALLAQAETGQTKIIPVLMRPSAWAHTPLAYLQAFPRDGKPLSELSDAQRERVWTDLTEVLEAELHRLGARQHGQSVSFRRVEDGDTTVRPVTRSTEDSGRGSSLGLPCSRKTSRFFISHAKEDGDFAENLKGRMREVGHDGWIDIDILEAGVDWRKEIDAAILDSQALILILSPDSRQSEYVTYEWAFALGSGLRIVPLMLRDTAIHPRLEIFQYLDFTNRRARPWERLFALLADISKAPNHGLQPAAAAQPRAAAAEGAR